MPRKRKHIEPDSEPSNTFEATLQALRPFVASYSMASDKRVKLRLKKAATKLEEGEQPEPGFPYIDAGERITISSDHMTYFVRFDELTYEDAAAIVARVFGETVE